MRLSEPVTHSALRSAPIPPKAIDSTTRPVGFPLILQFFPCYKAQVSMFHPQTQHPDDIAPRIRSEELSLLIAASKEPGPIGSAARERLRLLSIEWHQRRLGQLYRSRELQQPVASVASDQSGAQVSDGEPEEEFVHVAAHDDNLAAKVEALHLKIDLLARQFVSLELFKERDLQARLEMMNDVDRSQLQQQAQEIERLKQTEEKLRSELKRIEERDEKLLEGLVSIRDGYQAKE